MLKELFNKSKKKKYATIPSEAAKHDVPEGIMTKCPDCKKIMYTKELQKNLKVCIHCGFHHGMSSPERVDSFIDEGTFKELDHDLVSGNPLGFPDYEGKVEKDRKKTGMNEAVLTGSGKVNGIEVVTAIMDSRFRMGSMGSVVGEKITRAIEEADKRKVPFIIFTASGGARMQEGVLSLMQMAKTVGALRRLKSMRTASAGGPRQVGRQDAAPPAKARPLNLSPACMSPVLAACCAESHASRSASSLDFQMRPVPDP